MSHRTWCACCHDNLALAVHVAILYPVMQMTSLQVSCCSKGTSSQEPMR